jgi:C4-dicarboxylate-specific signal transduction histidine kinase
MENQGYREVLQDIKEHRNLSFAYVIEPDGTILASSNNPSLTGQKVSQDSFMSRFLSDQSRKDVVVLDEAFLEGGRTGRKGSISSRSHRTK